MSTQQQITTCLACESELTADNFCPTCEGWPTANGKGILKVLPGGGQSIRNITSEILALGDLIGETEPSFTFGHEDDKGNLTPGTYTTSLVIEDEWDQADMLENFHPQVTVTNSRQIGTEKWGYDLTVTVPEETTFDLNAEVDFALRNFDMADPNNEGFPHRIGLVKKI